MSTPEILSCESVCSPEVQLGCIKRVGETAVLMTSMDELNDQNTDFEARPYQIDAWRAIAEARTNGDTTALIHLATGLGKTTVAVLDALRFIDEHNQDIDQDDYTMPRILFAVNQNEILEQASERFTTFAPNIEQGFLNQYSKEPNAAIVFATLQSLHENMDNFDDDHFDYIIYDEAHHMQADTFKEVAKHFKPQFQLALTATPDRMDGLDIRELFGEETYSKNLAEALTEGWLADVDYHIVIDDAVKEAMQAGFEGMTIKAIKELLSNESRNEKIADQVRNEIVKLGLENAKTILFCQSIEHAEVMAELLGGKAYHSALDEDSKRKTLRNFKSGGVNLISTRDMFNEGVDIPDARLVVFLRSTGSSTIFEQQLGRGLRKTATKNTVTVLDFVANIERLEHLKDFADDVKRTQNNEESIPGEQSDTHDNTEREGLTIHSPHGDFDFDKIAVDLLDKISSLRADIDVWSKAEDEDLIALALKLSPKKALTQNQINEFSRKGEFPSSSFIYKRFGGTRIFAQACGFTGSWKGATKEDILLAALDLELEERPSKTIIEDLASKGNLPTPATIRKHFGTLATFQEALGFKTSEAFRYETSEDIIEQAKKLSPEEPFSGAKIDDFKKRNLFVGRSTIDRHFGSLKQFNQACGYEASPSGSFRKVSDKYKHTPDSVLTTATSLGLKPPVKKVDVDELSKQKQFVSYPVINNLFGTMAEFNKALAETIEPTTE